MIHGPSNVKFVHFIHTKSILGQIRKQWSFEYFVFFSLHGSTKMKKYKTKIVPSPLCMHAHTI